jgi:ATP-dependent DNA helicase DinG
VTKIDDFSQPVPPGFVRWLEAGSSIRLVEAPLDISAAMGSMMAARDPLTADHRSWIFTSATLGSGPSMDLFVGHCGLEGAELLQVESPFNYAAQAALYVPQHMPKPNDPEHSSQVAALAAQGAEVIGGRTLVLTTTLRAMRQIGALLAQYFESNSNIDVLMQGQSSKRELMDRFCRGGDLGARGCILVASNSFWEGVDIPGDALQLLVIDKLPFAPPNDPLVEARSEQLVAEGKNAFQNFHLPLAAIALRQGAGRLIRRETDRGILVVCDVRLIQMGYGKKMRAALPPMRALSTPDQFWEALSQLTKPSTTDQNLTGLP